MSHLRRFNPDGRPVFITCVTFNRAPLLIDHADLVEEGRILCETRYKFERLAWVILPDHLHIVIAVGDNDLARIVHSFKMQFLGFYRKETGDYSARIWQNRYWDHVIRNERDLRRHIDYVHFNPVRHGIATNLFQYAHSSASLHLAQGYYEPDWGVTDEYDGKLFGE